MNNDVRKLLKETFQNDVQEKQKQKKIAALQKRIKENNQFLYLEIYQQLIEQFKEKSDDPKNRLKLELRFKSYEFADKNDKELIDSLEYSVKSGIGIYNSSNCGEILINAKDVQTELVEDGFIECPSYMYIGEDVKYKFAGWNEDERLKDNTLSIAITVERLRGIMERVAKESPLIRNSNRK